MFVVSPVVSGDRVVTECASGRGWRPSPGLSHDSLPVSVSQRTLGRGPLSSHSLTAAAVEAAGEAVAEAAGEAVAEAAVLVPPSPRRRPP